MSCGPIQFRFRKLAVSLWIPVYCIHIRLCTINYTSYVISMQLNLGSQTVEVLSRCSTHVYLAVQIWMNKHYCGDVLILMAVTVYLTSHFDSVFFSFLASIACCTLFILTLLMCTLVRQPWWKVNIAELQIFPKQSGNGSPNQCTRDSINTPLLNICQQCEMILWNTHYKLVLWIEQKI